MAYYPSMFHIKNKCNFMDTNLIASSNQYNIGVSCNQSNIIFNKILRLNYGLMTPLKVINSIVGQAVNLTYDPNSHSTLILTNTNNGNILINLGDLADGQTLIIFRTNINNGLTVNFTNSTSGRYYTNSQITPIVGGYAIGAFGFYKLIYEKSTKFWHFVQIVNA